jgi:hypothetical protein
MRTALLLLLVGAASRADEDFGVWKLNPARSTPAGNHRSVTLRIERHTRGEVFTLDTVAADGRASTFSTILYLDGKARDFQDSACSGAQSSRRVDGRTIEISRKCANGGWTRFVRRLLAQPNELVLEITEEQTGGRRFEQHLVLERQDQSK